MLCQLLLSQLGIDTYFSCFVLYKAVFLQHSCGVACVLKQAMVSSVSLEWRLVILFAALQCGALRTRAPPPRICWGAAVLPSYVGHRHRSRSWKTPTGMPRQLLDGPRHRFRLRLHTASPQCCFYAMFYFVSLFTFSQYLFLGHGEVIFGWHPGSLRNCLFILHITPFSMKQEHVSNFLLLQSQRYQRPIVSSSVPACVIWQHTVLFTTSSQPQY